jgi:hypothetical protein
MPYLLYLLKEYLVNKDMDDEEQDNFMKVAIVEDKAYWIVGNVLYQTDFIDGEIIKEYAEPVNAFDMDYREVNKLMMVLDNMQDWKN